MEFFQVAKSLVDADRRTAAIRRRMIQYGGMHVECMACGWKTRHLPSPDNPLRLLRHGAHPDDVAGQRCGGRFRPRWWIIQNPLKAAEERGLKPGECDLCAGRHLTEDHHAHA